MKDFMMTKLRQIDRACTRDLEYDISLLIDMISDDWVLPANKEIESNAKKILNWYESELENLKNELHAKAKSVGYDTCINQIK